MVSPNGPGIDGIGLGAFLQRLVKVMAGLWINHIGFDHMGSTECL